LGHSAAVISQIPATTEGDLFEGAAGPRG